MWKVISMILLSLLSFRAQQAFSRFWEGTGLLHMMRGEWFDTVSNCIAFSMVAKIKKPKETEIFRACLIRLMSLAHGTALEELAASGVKVEFIDVLGLDNDTIQHLHTCANLGFNRVEVMLHLVQSLITSNIEAGVVLIPSPIASRVFQTVSRGFVNFLNAKKICDTKFPFPFVQLITFLLLLNSVLTPVCLAAIISNKILCAFWTILPIFCMYCINFCAIELENPFGTDVNDLPLNHFQVEMNSCLLMLAHDNTDIVPTTCKARCIDDFRRLWRACCHPEGAILDRATTHSRLNAFVGTPVAQISSIGSHNKVHRFGASPFSHDFKEQFASSGATPEDRHRSRRDRHARSSLDSCGLQSREIEGRHSTDTFASYAEKRKKTIEFQSSLREGMQERILDEHVDDDFARLGPPVAGPLTAVLPSETVQAAHVPQSLMPATSATLDEMQGEPRTPEPLPNAMGQAPRLRLSAFRWANSSEFRDHTHKWTGMLETDHKQFAEGLNYLRSQSDAFVSFESTASQWEAAVAPP
jgi:predicted membrane chloride channel (bestrophin family)